MNETLDTTLVIMLIIFLIMFVSNLYLNNEIFGMIAGMWLIVIAGAILVSGIQLQSGLTMSTSGSNTSIVYNYSDLVLPFPSPASVIFGIFLICVSIYIIYKNALEL